MAWFGLPALASTSVGVFPALLGFTHAVSWFHVHVGIVVGFVIVSEELSVRSLHLHEFFLHSLGIVVFTPSSLHVTLSWVVAVITVLRALSTVEAATHVTSMFVAHASFVTLVHSFIPTLVTVMARLSIVE